MSEAYYVSSLVAQMAPEAVETVCNAIKEIEFADVPLSDPRGKAVVLIDAPGMSELMKITEQIQEIEGVFSLLPVYQHQELDDQQELNQQQKDLTSSNGLETTL